MEEKVSEDVALAEVQRFIEAMDMDLERHTDEKLQDNVDGAKRAIVRAIRRGSLVIDDDGLPVFSPVVSGGADIVFREPTGGMIAEISKLDVDQGIIGCAKITGEPVSRFRNMKKRDFSVCEAIGVLFLLA